MKLIPTLIAAVGLTATIMAALGADLPTCQHQSPGRSPSYGPAAQKAGFHQVAHSNCKPEGTKS